MQPDKKNPKKLEESLGADSSNNLQANLIDGFIATTLLSGLTYGFFPKTSLAESIQNTTNTIYNFCQTFSSYIDFLS